MSTILHQMTTEIRTPTFLPKTSPFTKEQLDILQKLFNQSSLSQSSTPASGSGLLA
jgi:hypothetical protein